MFTVRTTVLRKHSAQHCVRVYTDSREGGGGGAWMRATGLINLFFAPDLTTVELEYVSFKPEEGHVLPLCLFLEIERLRMWVY